MTDGRIPEGRKPLTDADMAALTHRLADTAIEQSELYQAAKRDAEDAEAYAAELEAKLAKAVDGLRQCEAEIDDYIRHEYPGDHPVQARYRKRDFDANPARATLAELTGGKHE